MEQFSWVWNKVKQFDNKWKWKIKHKVFGAEIQNNNISVLSFLPLPLGLGSVHLLLFVDNQCDQMVKLFFNFGPFKTMKNLPNNEKNYHNRFKSCPTLNKPLVKKLKCLKNVTIMSKFRQIWSHCLVIMLHNEAL